MKKITGFRSTLGDETPVKTMKDCSVVTATYELGEGMKGTIGIIGPQAYGLRTCHEDAENSAERVGCNFIIKTRKNRKVIAGGREYE